jgi:hypothetical protein
MFGSPGVHIILSDSDSPFHMNETAGRLVWSAAWFYICERAKAKSVRIHFMREEVRSALKKIDRIGHALVSGGHAWDEAMFNFALRIEKLTSAERQLISGWISAWRRRVNDANHPKT